MKWVLNALFLLLAFEAGAANYQAVLSSLELFAKGMRMSTKVGVAENADVALLKAQSINAKFLMKTNKGMRIYLSESANHLGRKSVNIITIRETNVLGENFLRGSMQFEAIERGVLQDTISRQSLVAKDLIEESGLPSHMGRFDSPRVFTMSNGQPGFEIVGRTLVANGQNVRVATELKLDYFLIKELDLANIDELVERLSAL